MGYKQNLSYKSKPGEDIKIPMPKLLNEPYLISYYSEFSAFRSGGMCILKVKGTKCLALNYSN